MDENKDASLVCLNGHMITNRTHTLPNSNKKLCPECGEPTTSVCPNCDTDIPGAIAKARQTSTIPDSQGNYPSELVWSQEPNVPFAYCHYCGEPYPWTDRKIQAAVEMIDLLEEISDEEKGKLKADIPDIMHKTPRSEIAGTRFKNAIDKTQGHMQILLMNLLSNVVYDGLKELMGLVK